MSTFNKEKDNITKKSPALTPVNPSPLIEGANVSGMVTPTPTEAGINSQVAMLKQMGTTGQQTMVNRIAHRQGNQHVVQLMSAMQGSRSASKNGPVVQTKPMPENQDGEMNLAPEQALAIEQAAQQNQQANDDDSNDTKNSALAIKNPTRRAEQIIPPATTNLDAIINTNQPTIQPNQPIQPPSETYEPNLTTILDDRTDPLAPLLEGLDTTPFSQLEPAFGGINEQTPDLWQQDRATIDQKWPHELRLPLGSPTLAEVTGEEDIPQFETIKDTINETIDMPQDQAEVTEIATETLSLEDSSKTSQSTETPPPKEQTTEDNQIETKSNVSTDAGPRPMVDLTAEANPAQIKQQQHARGQKMANLLNQTTSIAQADYGETAIYAPGLPQSTEFNNPFPDIKSNEALKMPTEPLTAASEKITAESEHINHQLTEQQNLHNTEAAQLNNIVLESTDVGDEITQAEQEQVEAESQLQETETEYNELTEQLTEGQETYQEQEDSLDQAQKQLEQSEKTSSAQTSPTVQRKEIKQASSPQNTAPDLQQAKQQLEQKQAQHQEMGDKLQQMEAQSEQAQIALDQKAAENDQANTDLNQTTADHTTLDQTLDIAQTGHQMGTDALANTANWPVESALQQTVNQQIGPDVQAEVNQAITEHQAQWDDKQQQMQSILNEGQAELTDLIAEEQSNLADIQTSTLDEVNTLKTNWQSTNQSMMDDYIDESNAIQEAGKQEITTQVLEGEGEADLILKDGEGKAEMAKADAEQEAADLWAKAQSEAADAETDEEAQAALDTARSAVDSVLATMKSNVQTIIADHQGSAQELIEKIQTEVASTLETITTNYETLDDNLHFKFDDHTEQFEDELAGTIADGLADVSQLAFETGIIRPKEMNDSLAQTLAEHEDEFGSPWPFVSKLPEKMQDSFEGYWPDLEYDLSRIIDDTTYVDGNTYGLYTLGPEGAALAGAMWRVGQFINNIDTDADDFAGFDAIQGQLDNLKSDMCFTGELGELQESLAIIAESRGIEYIDAVDQLKLTVKLAEDAHQFHGDSPSDTAFADQDHWIWGSHSQLAYGDVVAQNINPALDGPLDMDLNELLGEQSNVTGIDPAFAALLNPTGGIVGPGGLDVLSTAEGFGFDPLAVTLHGIPHDAAGYLHNYHGLGPGYGYEGNMSFMGNSNPLQGQIHGIMNMQNNLDELRELGWTPSEAQQGVYDRFSDVDAEAERYEAREAQSRANRQASIAQNQPPQPSTTNTNQPQPQPQPVRTPVPNQQQYQPESEQDDDDEIPVSTPTPTPTATPTPTP